MRELRNYKDDFGVWQSYNHSEEKSNLVEISIGMLGAKAVAYVGPSVRLSCSNSGFLGEDYPRNYQERFYPAHMEEISDFTFQDPRRQCSLRKTAGTAVEIGFATKLSFESRRPVELPPLSLMM